MQKMFAPSQVEMRQIGPRDVAKLLCGMGACGLEMRCCCAFLTEFSSISIRMAKEQGISLTPSEITGMCGRLRCCLIYEYDQYVDARKSLPKRNKRVQTPQGEGKVVDVVPLREAVLVELPDIGVREFPGAEVKVLDGDSSARAGGETPPAGSEEALPQPPEGNRAPSGEERMPPDVEIVDISGPIIPVEPTKQRPPRREPKAKPEMGRQVEGGSRAGEKQERSEVGSGHLQSRERHHRPAAGRVNPAEPGHEEHASTEKSPVDRRPGEGQKPTGKRNSPNRGKAPRPPQYRGPVERETGGPGTAGEAGEQDKRSNLGHSADRNTKEVRNKRKGRQQHGRDDNENRT